MSKPVWRGLYGVGVAMLAAAFGAEGWQPFAVVTGSIVVGLGARYGWNDTANRETNRVT